MTQEEQKKVIEPKIAASDPSPSKAIVLVVAAKEPEEEKKEGSVYRDAVLARLEQDKRMSLIKAWEEAEKSKVENKAQKKLSSVGAWENSKKASVEAELKKIEEQLIKKKAKYAEQMKNKIAQIHKEAEEKRAMTEAKRGEDVLKAEEMAAKYRRHRNCSNEAIWMLLIYMDIMDFDVTLLLKDYLWLRLLVWV